MEQEVNGASQIWSTLKFQASFKKAGGGGSLLRVAASYNYIINTILSQEKLWSGQRRWPQESQKLDSAATGAHISVSRCAV